MRTKDIIDKTGIDRETIRFYESKGLLPAVKRTNSGYRIFPELTLERIEFIRKAKDAGFTLSEIKELIEIQSKKESCRKARDAMKIKSAEIKDRIKTLKKMDAVIQKFINECEKDNETSLKDPCHFSFEAPFKT